MIPNGANTYTYSSGSNTVSPASNSTYTVTGSGINGCVNSVGAISTVSVLAAPVLAAQNAGVCVGTSAVLNVSGANSYSWTTGATTTSISVSPTVTTNYAVTGTNLNNCSSTQTLAVTVNQACQDVWPGDANSDGVADNFDVLELGLHFIQTGPARATTSNAWQSYFANNWTGTISNGKNVNHSDCNGDGTINNNDTLAIFNNYGLTHAFKSTEPTATNPQLSIVPDQNAVAKGSWGTSSVFLGEASAPVTNINGLAFTVTFDQNLVDANSFYIEYPVSFLNTGNQNLKFSKPDFANGKLYTATTHTITNNVSGNGKIAVLHYKVKSALATDDVLNLGITQAKQSNAAGTLTPLTVGAATIAAIGASVGMDELSNGNSVGMYPNPANSSVTIQSNTKLEKVELLSITGQIMLSEKGSGTHYQLDLANIANGVYMVHIYSADQRVTRKKLVVQR
ncbi:MAG: T9SS type A sorting domain-containing protein [Bacteroidia bacterium]|nr:T9SS type A sorting domain-containing protein [Bacteroidia bacterium]